MENVEFDQFFHYSSRSPEASLAQIEGPGAFETESRRRPQNSASQKKRPRPRPTRRLRRSRLAVYYNRRLRPSTRSRPSRLSRLWISECLGSVRVRTFHSSMKLLHDMKFNEIPPISHKMSHNHSKLGKYKNANLCKHLQNRQNIVKSLKSLQILANFVMRVFEVS